MANASVDFILNPQETVDVDFTVTPDVTYQAVLDLSASTRNHDELSNRDLPDQHPTSAITGLDDTLGSLTESVSTIEGTIETYGDVVTHNADEFATAEQGALADTALQAGDNITELVNNAGYLRASSLNGYATEGYVNAEIGNITDILDSYGNIVTHNVNEFATAAQGAKADTALQSGDNISELTNDVNYATESFVEDKIEDVTDTFGDIVTHNVSEFATSAQGALADTALQPNDDISELNNDVGYITSASLPTVNNGTLTIQKNGSSVGTFTANQATNTTVNVVVPTQASDIGALPDTTTIADLTTTAQLNALNSGATTTNIGQITTNENDISDINDKIPSQASSSNQLADKNFVNSSIATNTANFIGTFNSVAELEAYSGTLTNNDYAFVQTTDTAGNTLYDRYKWNGSAWLFEYELNNSSFTAEQWATINSGATSSDVALAQSALQPNDNVSELVNDAGYITSASLPTVNDATLTIQKNGVDVQTFTANQSANATANITVPTDTSDLTNGAGFITGITSGDVTTALGYTPADNSDVVHKTGAETIGGNKTFSNDVTFSNPVTFNQTTTFNTGASQFYNGGYRMWKYKMASGNTYEDQSYYDSSNNFLGSFRVFDTGVASFLSFSETKTIPPTEDTTTSTQIDTVGARNTKLADYVTTNTAQTISGAKTFTNQTTLFSSDAERYIVLKNTSADALTAPSSDLYTGTISTRDKNDKQITNIRSAILSNGTSRLTYNVRQYSEGNKHIQGVFRLDVDSSGGASMLFSASNNGSGDTRTATNKCLSTSSSSTTETRLACQGWVNNASTATNVVHRSSAETITGTKTFNSTTQPQIIRKNTNQSLSNPTSEVYTTESYRDTNDVSIGMVYSLTATYGCGVGMRVASWGNYKGFRVQGDYSTGETKFIVDTTKTQVTAPTDDNTTSLQIDTVGMRNTKINSVLQSLMPTGTVLPYGGSSAPTGFLMCDGSAVSRTDYADLFDVIGTTYGSGDGSTTFNLPNLSTAVLPSSSTVSVVGNGNALGLTDDLSSAPKAQMVVDKVSGLSGQNTYSAQWSPTQPLAVGTVASSYGKAGTEGKGLGVSQDPDYSGLTGSITGVTLNYIIRT